MYIRRKSDGKIFRDITEAVEAFKCPGPCSSDCNLYQPIQINPDDDYVHMCNARYAMNHPEAVANAIGCEILQGQPPLPADSVHVAVIKASAVRDVQFAKTADAAVEDDDAWSDLPDAEIFLGIFAGPDALEEAAAYGNTDPANVRLIEIQK